MEMLFRQIAENPDFQVRLKWEKNTVAIWDNRVIRRSASCPLDDILMLIQVATHSAIFDFWPERRHALRVTPHGEKPMSVAEYEAKTGKIAKDRQIEIWESLGIDPSGNVKKNGSGPRGYND